MGTIEDIRKVIQDLVAPDLKAISARIDGLEKTMNARFEGVDAKFEGVDAKLEGLEKTMNAKFAGVDAKLEGLEKMMNLRHESLLGTMAANHASIMNLLQIDKRVARLEEQANANAPQHV